MTHCVKLTVTRKTKCIAGCACAGNQPRHSGHLNVGDRTFD